MSSHGSRKAVAFGESLLRLAAVGDQLAHARTLDVRVGGAELNCLTALAAFGWETRWLTRLAADPLGQRIAAHASEYGVDAQVEWDDHARAPLYFVDHAVPPRRTRVLYDRDESAMRRATAESFDWQAHLFGADVALSTGITCALGRGVASAVSNFFSTARDCGVTVAFDVNFRRKLWDWSEATRVLGDVLPMVDVLSAGRADLLKLLPLAARRDPAAQTDVELARLAIDAWSLEAVIMRERKTDSPGTAIVTTCVVTPNDAAESAPEAAQVIDGFGAGDAALAAFIYGRARGADLPELAQWCSRAAALQLTVPGDAWQGGLDELLAPATEGIDR